MWSNISKLTPFVIFVELHLNNLIIVTITLLSEHSILVCTKHSFF